MTTHVPDPFTFLPFRKGDTKEPEWSCLLKFIKTNFASNFNSQIQGAVDRLTEYKKVIVQTCTNELKMPPNEAFIEQTLKPYVQLVSTAQAHLPLHGGLVKNLNFEWRDSLDDSAKHQSNNSNVEVFSCIYNIASSYAYTASVDAESGTVDGLKGGFKTYQVAAGYYQAAEGFLKRLPSACVQRDATVESLAIMQKLCLCQAHHCGYLKAEIEMHGKHALLSKIAAEAGKFYDDVHKSVAAQGWPRTSLVKDIETYTANLSHVFNARAHLHLAAERMDAGEVGDAIARYNAAAHHLQRVVKFNNNNMNVWMNGVRAVASEFHGKAVGANETVYFLRIPKELPPLEGLGKPLGKPTPAPVITKVISNRDADPFFGIVPAHIAEVANKHFASMQQLANSCSKSVAAYRDKVRSHLNALGVTAVIEALSSETKDQGRLPEPLRSKLGALHPPGSKSVVEGLVNQTTQAEELRDACVAKLEQAAAVLQEEQTVDERLAAQYGDKLWRGYRCPSVLAPTYQEVQRMLQQAREQLVEQVNKPLADLKRTLGGSLNELARLDWPASDLDALMPFMKTKAVKEQTKAVQEAIEKLRKVNDRLNQIDEQNNQKLKELNTALQNDSVVHSLSGVDADQHEAILDAASNEVKDLVACVQGNTASGEALLDQAQEIISSLALSRSEDPTAAEIQKICNMLETTLNLYSRLSQDATEIGTAASQQLETLEGVLSTAKSFALSRSLEAEDIKTNIESQIAAKVREMKERQQAEETISESQKRQEAIKKELDELERQRIMTAQQRMARAADTSSVQQQLHQQSEEVMRTERLQQLLQQQRMQVATASPIEPPAPPPYPPPPPTYAYPTAASSSTMGSSPSTVVPQPYLPATAPQLQQQPLYANFGAQQQSGAGPYAQALSGPPHFTSSNQPPSPSAPPPYLQQLPHPQQYSYGR